jgi:hypothetical protein
MKANLLICTCGDCLHWELLQQSIVCKSCGIEFPIPGLGKFIQEHVDKHDALAWKEHER